MDGHDVHRIAQGVRGWLESPHPGAPAHDCLIVSGWAFARESTIVEIRAAGPGFDVPLRHNLPRDDVARVYPSEPNAAASGFSGYVELAEAPRGAMALEISATLADGRRIRLFKRHVSSALAPDVPSRLRWAFRHVVERPRLLVSRRSWRDALAMLKAWSMRESRRSRAQHGSPDAVAPPDRVELASFLSTDRTLVCTAAEEPLVSVIVVVWNRAELTFKCLQAVARQADVPLEIIVVDNASSDDTRRLLDRASGLTAIRNPTNVGFTVAANLGAKAARGEFLLFLNNDAVLASDCIGHLVATARRSSAIGAVGGKLVYPDGRLQEAGSIVWSDGSCEAYGRGGDPGAPEFNFERRVDFCSGALLLTRRGLFNRLGGFDERYRPAYYEDADYCARLWTNGLSVVYQPKAVAIHQEFGSAASPDAGIELQRARRPIFAMRHSRWLSSQSSRVDGPLAARSHPHRQPAVALIDDAAPNPAKGAGFPRSAALVEALEGLGYLVTIYATAEGSRTAPKGRLSTVEIVAGGPHGLRAFFASRPDFHSVIVSRPHNMQYVKAAVGSDLSALHMPCIYDAEAIFALREVGRRELAGTPVPPSEREQMIDAELRLARGCAAVVAVSERERALFAEASIPKVSVLAHAVDAVATPNAFERRRSVLFVGAFSAESPNEDAALHLCREVLPAFRALNLTAPLVIAGAGITDRIKAAGPTVSWHADVDDLTAFYDDARVFVAPTRYGAGIPLKVIEAASRGVPIVATPLVAWQLGWQNGVELLTAADPEEFARAIAALYDDERAWNRLRECALARVHKEHSAAAFRDALRHAIDAATPSSAAAGPRTFRA